MAYFSAIGSEQSFTAPSTGTYKIEAAGASGAVGNSYSGDYGSTPGKGARMSLSVLLNAGDELLLIVGKQGTGTTGTAKDGASGGSGGGTFVFRRIGAITNPDYQFTKNGVNYEVLLVAAGGGGTGDQSYKSARSNGADGIGAGYKNPSNYTAWSAQTASLSSSVSLSAPLSISQFIANGAGGAHYTRGASTGTGGYGMGSATDDNPSCGGGWSGNNAGVYSWAIDNTAVGQTGVNTGDGYVEIVVPAHVSITQDPSPATYILGDSPAALSVAAAGNGTLSYQWQSSLNQSDWADISGATEQSYTPAIPSVGVTYYRCQVTDTVGGPPLYPSATLYPGPALYPMAEGRYSTDTADSAAAAITVVGAVAPTITAQPVSAAYDQGAAAAALTVAATVPSGTLSYQWQSSGGQEVWSDIEGAAEASFLPPTSGSGTTHYRCIVTNTLGSTQASTASDSASVTIRTAALPTITAQPQSSEYPLQGTAAALAVEAQASYGSLSYQWQASEDGETWADIAGATGTSYTPPTTAVGERRYRAAVTNTVGTSTATAVSDAAAVTVYTASPPVIVTQPVGAEYGQGEQAEPLSVTATAAHGGIIYQWEASEDGVSWTAIPGAADSVYQPSTGQGGTRYYRCVVTNQVGEAEASTVSQAAEIVVRTAEAPAFLAPLVGAEYDQGAVVTPLEGAASASYGTISYQWYASSDGGETFAPVAGATEDSYTPPSDVPHETAYYVEATNTVGTSTATAQSNVVIVAVYGASVPVFVVQPVSADYIEHETPVPLTALASAPRGTLSYGWQSSTDGTNWTNLPQERAGRADAGTEYTPDTGTPGIRYYRAVATNTVGTSTAAGVSASAQVRVTAAQVPVFLFPLGAVEYSYGALTEPLNGTAEVTDGGEISYQWYGAGAEGAFSPIEGAIYATYQPPSIQVGVFRYYVVATNTLETSQRSATSQTATVTIIDRRWTAAEKLQDYLRQLRTPFVKLCRLRFLQPDGSTAFALDNNPRNRRSGAFIAEGTISCNLQNGTRRTASVTLSNLDGAYDYSVNKVWFGQEIAIDEGLILSNGEEYYIQQGIFCVESPVETVEPGKRTAQYNLTDKWAMLDGTLFGYLEGTYEAKMGTNIFAPIQALLKLDRGNGLPVDRVTPIFTEYYNGKTQALPDGTTAKLTDAPYTLRVEGESGSYADVVLGLAAMVNAWTGYDATGALRLDPSQDDILDTNKPVLWQFSMEETQILGAAYTVKNTEVYNDYIVIGELLDDNSQPAGRATNLDPMSDTNVQTIGRKTFRESAAGYATKRQCEDLAVWRLKRATGLQKAVSIQCTQMFHIEEGNLVTVVRTDKPGAPVERHLIMGFERPLASTGPMTITAVSVNDYPNATVTGWPE